MCLCYACANGYKRLISATPLVLLKLGAVLDKKIRDVCGIVPHIEMLAIIQKKGNQTVQIKQHREIIL